MTKFFIRGLVLFLLLGSVIFFAARGDFSVRHYAGLSAVMAADDEEEDEREEDEREDDERDSYDDSNQKQVEAVTQKEIIQEVVEYKSVTKQVTITSEGYDKDSDGDGLVDALDPNVFVKQSEYFTDIDGDGVPNALDKHHDEDDFAFFDDMDTDSNQNGILDSYEQ